MATSLPLGKAEAGAGHASGTVRGLALAALGVVYGDIGTSPLYTIKEAFGEAGGLHESERRRAGRALARLLVADPGRHA